MTKEEIYAILAMEDEDERESSIATMSARDGEALTTIETLTADNENLRADVAERDEQISKLSDEEKEKLMREQMQGDLFSEAEAKRQVKELRKVPFFVRGKARRNTERFAQERSLGQITLETLYDAKAHFGR